MTDCHYFMLIFFHWAGKQIFFSFYIFIIFITSQMAPRKKTPLVSKKPNQRTMVARKNTLVKSSRGKFYISEVVRIVFIYAYCQQSRFQNYSNNFQILNISRILISRKKIIPRCLISWNH